MNIRLQYMITALLASAMSLPLFWERLKLLDSPWGTGDMTNYYALVRNWNAWGFSRAVDRNFPIGVDPNLYSGESVLSYLFASPVYLLTGSPYAGLNILYLLSFPVVAALTLTCLRLAQLHGPLAILLSISFTFIPFHLGRGLQHIHLAMLFGVVTGVLATLIIGLGIWNSWIERNNSKSKAGILFTCALVVLTSLSSLYFADFTCILLGAAIGWRWSRGDNPRKLVSQAFPVLILVMTVVLSLIPAFLARRSIAGGTLVGERSVSDSVTYAGNLLSLILPAHLPTALGLDWYTELYTRWLASAPPNESHLGSNAGTWLSFFCLVIFILGLGADARSRSRRHEITVLPTETQVASHTGILTMVAYLLVTSIVFFVPFGLNFLVANLLTTQIRAWGRLAPILLLLIFVGAAAVLGQRRQLNQGRVPLVLTAIGLLVVMWLQILPFRSIFVYTALEGSKRLEAGRQYADSVNAVLPQTCAVLTLPFMDYPNNGGVGPAIDDYDPLLLTLTNDTKPISYGGHRGTSEVMILDEFRPNSMDELPTIQEFSRLRQLGYCAVHLDRGGWIDATTIHDQLASALGPPVATGRDGQWEMFVLE